MRTYRPSERYLDSSGIAASIGFKMGTMNAGAFLDTRRIASVFWKIAAAETRPLWRDYSYWNNPVNPGIAVANGVLGMVHRAGISWGYKDPYFRSVYDGFGQHEGIYRTSYHVLYTDQSIGAQIDNWYAVHPELDPVHPIPRVIDLEVDRGDSRAHKAEATWNMCEAVLARDGLYPIIYSRYLLINDWLIPYWTDTQIGRIVWWLAQYLADRKIEHPGPPTLPNKVLMENVFLQQTADKKAPFPGEVGSLSVDWDRCLWGTEDQMRRKIHERWGGDPPPPPPTGFFMRCIQEGLRIRTEPNEYAPEVGTLSYGEQVEVLDIGGSYSWIQHERGWSNVQDGADRNMEKA